jgi:hypothetical protein
MVRAAAETLAEDRPKLEAAMVRAKAAHVPTRDPISNQTQQSTVRDACNCIDSIVAMTSTTSKAGDQTTARKALFDIMHKEGFGHLWNFAVEMARKNVEQARRAA